MEIWFRVTAKSMIFYGIMKMKWNFHIINFIVGYLFRVSRSDYLKIYKVRQINYFSLLETAFFLSLTIDIIITIMELDIIFNSNIASINFFKRVYLMHIYYQHPKTLKDNFNFINLTTIFGLMRTIFFTYKIISFLVLCFIDYFSIIHN